MGIYLGVDGGGSTTRALIYDDTSASVAAVTGMSTRPSLAGWDGARDILVDLARQAAAQLGTPVQQIRGISACLSGIDLPAQSQRLREALQASFPKAAIEVTNDAMAPLTAGTMGASGVVFIGGTGTVAVGETAEGRVARAGGYGYLIGDEGSGFALGRGGLLAAIEYAEQRGPATTLWDAAQRQFRVSQPNQLLPLVYDAENPVAVVATFAEAVIVAAGGAGVPLDRGAVAGDAVTDRDKASGVDTVALALVETAARHQAALIQSVFFQLPEVARHVIVSGGLFQKDNGMLARLRASLPEVRIERLQRDAVAGALIRALRLSRDARVSGWGPPDGLAGAIAQQPELSPFC